MYQYTMTISGSYSIKISSDHNNSIRVSLYINDRFIQRVKPNRMFLGGAPIHADLLQKGSVSIVTSDFLLEHSPNSNMVKLTSDAAGAASGGAADFEVLTRHYPNMSWEAKCNDGVDIITQLVAIGNKFYNMNYSRDGSITLVKKEVKIILTT